MKACLLKTPAAIESHPLEFVDVAAPEPAAGEMLVRVHYCGVCRTDLHVIEGELEPRKSPVIPGHQVVGVVEKFSAAAPELRSGSAGAPLSAVAPGPERSGEATAKIGIGSRVGIAWLHHTDGTCRYCLAGEENLCDKPSFTGYTVDGGYAEYIVAPQDFVYPIPEEFADEQAAPLLCAGIIGFRCLRQSGIKPGGKLGFYGFGAAAHVAIQVARHWNIEVYASTRDARHQKLALELGAKWAGGTVAEPPVKLDAAIIFAPAGEIVPAALRALRKGGTLVLGGIYLSPIPPLEYEWLYQERVIRSVANNTRQDGHDFLRVAAEIPIRTRVQMYPLADANRALNALKNDAIPGAAVLKVR